MAGWLFSLGDEEDLGKCFKKGCYSTNIKIDSKSPIAFEGTFADFSSMKEGDNVYFFSKRKIYGIGKLINLDKGNCVFENYGGASRKMASTDKIYLTDLRDSNPWVCFFIPCPSFFKKGVDIDEVLSSTSDKFIAMRSFWKLSFTKLDEGENQALFDIILRKNKDYIENNKKNYEFNLAFQVEIQEKLKIEKDKYSLKLGEFLEKFSDGDKIKHEMALEAGIMNQISTKELGTIKSFGEWDFINHQVIASPFKPIDYIDKMDIFGYKKIKGFPTISKYLVVELKKGKVMKSDLNQLLKYVDWVSQNYVSNNYGMIESFLVGYEFEDELLEEVKKVERDYMKGYRPPKFAKWNNIKLLKYSYNSEKKILEFI